MRSPVQSWVPLLIEDIGDEALAGRMQVLFSCMDVAVGAAICGFKSPDKISVVIYSTPFNYTYSKSR